MLTQGWPTILPHHSSGFLTPSRFRLCRPRVDVLSALLRSSRSGGVMKSVVAAALALALGGCGNRELYLVCSGTAEHAMNDRALPRERSSLILQVEEDTQAILKLADDGSFVPVCSDCQQTVSPETIMWSRNMTAEDTIPNGEWFSIDRRTGELEGYRHSEMTRVAVRSVTKYDMRCDRRSSPPARKI